MTPRVHQASSPNSITQLFPIMEQLLLSRREACVFMDQPLDVADGNRGRDLEDPVANVLMKDCHP